jgi:mono/diheme cytochrome c family protein
MEAALLVLFFLALGVTVVLVAMRSGAKGPVLDSNRRGSRRALAWLLGLAVLAFVVAIPVAVAIDNSDAEATAGPVELNAQEEAGREVFNRNCVQCHILKASNSVQQVGPSLDALRPPKELVLDAIEKGRARGQGQMPAQLVTGPDAEAVAAYVAKVAGREAE